MNSNLVDQLDLSLYFMLYIYIYMCIINYYYYQHDESRGWEKGISCSVKIISIYKIKQSD